MAQARVSSDVSPLVTSHADTLGVSRLDRCLHRLAMRIQRR